MKYAWAVVVVGLLTGTLPAFGKTFNNTVSVQFSIPHHVDLHRAQSSMDNKWFTNKDGGRTVYSTDVVIGTVFRDNKKVAVRAHATWVIKYKSQTHTVNLRPDKTHISNWYGNNRCSVYENGECACASPKNWDVCDEALSSYMHKLVDAAAVASLTAARSLQAAGYKVTRQ